MSPLRRAKKEEHLTLARLARKYLCVPGTSIQAVQHTGCSCALVAPEQEGAEHVRGDCVHATILDR